MYAETRADDLVVTLHPRAAAPQPRAAAGADRRGRHRRDHPDRRPGPDHRPHRRAAGRAAEVRARLRHRPDVRRRDDRGDHRRRPASPSAPTTSPSPAASSTWAATRWARASTPTRASSPRSSSTRPRWSWARPRRTCTTGSRTSPRSAPTRSPLASQEKYAKAYANGQIEPGPGPDGAPARPSRAGAWPPRTSRRGPAPRWTTWPTLKTPFRPHGRVTAGNAAGLNDGATACLLAAEEIAARARACRSGCAWSATASPASSPRSWASARSRRPRRRWPAPG